MIADPARCSANLEVCSLTKHIRFRGVHFRVSGTHRKTTGNAASARERNRLQIDYSSVKRPNARVSLPLASGRKDYPITGNEVWRVSSGLVYRLAFEVPSTSEDSSTLASTPVRPHLLRQLVPYQRYLSYEREKKVACLIALTTAFLTLQYPKTFVQAHAHRPREVQTYLVIHHPPKASAQGRSTVAPGATAAAPRGHHAAASSISTSYGYQLHRETSHHVPVLITTGHIPVLARAPAHKTRRDRITAQGSSFRQKHNQYVRLPDYPGYLGRNAALSLEEDTLAEAEAEPTLKVYKADAEYPPLNMRNRRKLYSLGYIYMLDFLENSYLKR
ncbi:hypothetical protein HPB50_022541 [Hyalomma asiaticum]|uniref:Uncharacterized protein n=1 Tax=Hyalomma asiaticum TaxID=266040 RepID=A0ACB7S4S8_HYAAI|nr:hypothetical protein HPB50_022541 [Hyalomma asiaticum]